jgi:hypothetical protein
VFLLRKWYFDVTAPDGSVAIAYWAEVRWGRWVRRGSALFRSPSRQPDWRFGIPTGDEPSEQPAGIDWRSAELGCRLRLTPRLPPSEHRLLDLPPGAVVWRAVAPSAGAAFDFDDGSRVAGLGYAEWIELRIPPWKLPITTLRWGRFLSPSASLVWIAWEGDYPLRLVLYNGVSHPPVSIDDRTIRLEGGELRLSQPRPLADTDVSAMLAPSVLRPLAARLTNTWQTRWLSRGEFTGRDGIRLQGSAIHEVVHWGGDHA